MERTTIDPKEVEKFARIADKWWDTRGPFKPLHQLNPTRIGYLREVLYRFLSRSSLNGLSLLDVGCGGGLVCEPLAKLGAKMFGIDASESNIRAASIHAERAGLDVHYRTTTAEELAQGDETFDAVLALEILEHIADVPLFLRSLHSLVRPGGVVVLSTINRSVMSYLGAIIGAEYVLRWLPRGTHDWNKFITPAELADALREAGFRLVEQRGLRYHPLLCRWEINQRPYINYFAVAVRDSGAD